MKEFDPFSISIRCLQTTIYAQYSVSVCSSKVTIYVLLEEHVVVMRNFMLSIMKSSFLNLICNQQFSGAMALPRYLTKTSFSFHKGSAVQLTQLTSLSILRANQNRFLQSTSTILLIAHLEFYNFKRHFSLFIFQHPSSSKIK